MSGKTKRRIESNTGLFSKVKEILRVYRQSNPDSWKGRCIGFLAAWYDDYCKIPLMFQKQLKRTASDEIKKHLVLGVQYVCLSKVEGDMAEFGTMSGTTAHIIATALVAFSGKSRGVSKKLYLFDSFTGLPVVESPVDKVNPLVVSGVWSPGLLMVLDQWQLIAKVRKAGLAKDRIKVYAGWFRDTLPKLPDGTKFAMLHIDCDLYQSAMDVLDACFSRGFIADGAIILFDDWNVAVASPLLGERRAWSEVVKKYSVVYSDEGGYSWNAHKFIIHSYRREKC